MVSKTLRHKPYSDLQLLLILTDQWKNLSINFVTGLPVSTNLKSETYNSILVIVDRLTKMLYYELVMITIDALGLAKVITDIVV